MTLAAQISEWYKSFTPFFHVKKDPCYARSKTLSVIDQSCTPQTIKEDRQSVSRPGAGKELRRTHTS